MSLSGYTLGLHLYRMHTFTELNSFRDYIDHSVKSINLAQETFEMEYKKYELNNLGEEESGANIDYWSEEHVKFHDVFPAFFGQSTYISLFSFLETRLQSLCNHIQQARNYNMKVSDLSGENYIEKSKKYLKLVAGLDLNNLNTHWIKISDYQKIRNCFVHQNGNIITDINQPLDKQRFYTAVKAISDLKLESNGEIKIVSNAFLTNFITVIEDYLRALLEKIKSNNS